MASRITHFTPRTLEEAARDIAAWTAHKTRYPEAVGGVVFTEILMQDVCNRIMVLEKRQAAEYG